MKVLVILAHPHKESFNHAIACSAVDALKAKGHRAVFHDLYEEKFDPVLPYEEIPRAGIVDPIITKYCNELTEAGGIIFVHPNWWGQPPAILKGWIDRVIRPGVAYLFEEGDSGEGIPQGLLEGKRALVFNTSNTPDEREKKVFGDPLENMWKKCIFELCGITEYKRRTFNVIVTSTREERDTWLKEAHNIVDEFFQKDLVYLNSKF
ncbi:MAG: NAD(P)H dehydrogenase [Spirochaetes bacterium RBG_16_49_21]|nr:MAG: NAD(P)H dehydrogenase [Spirochaetes bacterium RBG_16_49_21]